MVDRLLLQRLDLQEVLFEIFGARAFTYSVNAELAVLKVDALLGIRTECFAQARSTALANLPTRLNDALQIHLLQ